MNIDIHQSLREINNYSEAFKKGFEFERYVLSLFNERSFDREWRNSLVTSNAFPQNYYSLPDLALMFLGNKKYRFAVECKWRQKFQKDGTIRWAEKEHISGYKKFEKEANIPVFIAIGIGGKPWNPAKLFVTPLKDISMRTDVYEKDLIPFKRKPTRKFFYDTFQLRLF